VARIDEAGCAEAFAAVLYDFACLPERLARRR